MGQRLVGILIGSFFGAVFVFANAQPPLPQPAADALRAAAAVALVLVVVLSVLAARRSAAGSRAASAAKSGGGAKPGGSGGAAGRPGEPSGDHRPGRRPAMYNRKYAAVVAAEAVLLFGGFAVLRALEAPTQANVAWIAFIVGLHFIALAWVWQERSIAVPGIALTVLGAAGCVLAAVSMAELVPIVSGVASGAVLLGCGVGVTAGSVAAAGRSGRR
ncbi:hypothetical protein GCM10027570_01600 [Streptomonospora sediminis]